MPPEDVPSLVEKVRLAWRAAAVGSDGIDLAAVLSGVSGDAADVADAIVEDAEQRAARGLDCTLEHYRRVVPAHAQRADVVRPLIMLEWSRRTAEAAEVVRADLLWRFPEHADEINTVGELAALMSDGADGATEPMPVTAGQQLGKYRLVERLGAGSFGEVWSAWDQALERYVALKLLPEETTEWSMLAAVMREAKSAASIDHEHVVKVHDAGRLETPPRCYIDAQLAGDPAPTPEDRKRVAVGRPLSVVAEGRGLAAREAARVMEAVCRGAAAAHARGIVHRDIKPSNIIVTPSGRPLLSDFGLSALSVNEAPELHVAAAPDERATGGTIGGGAGRGGRITGTPAFMSPEQARGEPAGPASDVYSLGATLRFAITGQLPFEPSGRHSTNGVWDVIEQVRRQERRTLSADRPNVPRDLAAICERAMASESADRYISAAAMADDLRAYLEGRPTVARPASPTRAAVMWARRHPAITILSAVMLGVVSAGLSVYIVDVGRERDRAVAAEAATRRQLAETERARATAESVNDFLQSVISAASPELLGKNATILDAVRFAEREISARFQNEPLVEAEIRSSLGTIMGALGEHAESRSNLDRAVELYQAHAGERAADTLRVRKLRAMQAWSLDMKPLSAAQVEKAVDDIRRELGPVHALTLAAETDLASVYASDHRFDWAHDLLMRAVEGWEQLGQQDMPAAMKALQMLAACKGFRGESEMAAAMLERLIERQGRVLGEGHYLRCMARVELATVYEQTLRWADAAEQYELAYHGLKDQLPRGHEYLYLCTRGAAAIMSNRIGQPQQGLDLLKPVFTDYLARSDREAYAEPSGHDVLGWCYLKLGRFEEAEREFVRAREGYIRVTGSDSNAVVRKIERALADVYDATGRADEAKRLRGDDAPSGPEDGSKWPVMR